MLLDLFAMAGENCNDLERRTNDILAPNSIEDREALQRFMQRVVDEGRISINGWADELLPFIDENRYCNIHEKLDKIPLLPGQTREDLLSEAKRKWYPKRCRFDDAVNEGRGLKYAALYLGGGGAEGYGPYCVVLRQGFTTDNPNLAYLWYDSLKRYVADLNNIDWARLSCEIASESHKQHLALWKLHLEVIALSRHHGLEDQAEAWGRLILSDLDYIEAVFTQDLTREEIEFVMAPRKLALIHSNVQNDLTYLPRLSPDHEDRDHALLFQSLEENNVTIDWYDDGFRQ